jgi:hypothetical protein
MTSRRHRILWFFAIYGLSLSSFAALAMLIRLLLRWIV